MGQNSRSKPGCRGQLQHTHLTTFTFSNKVGSRASSNATESFLGMLQMDLNINPQNQSPTQINPLITVGSNRLPMQFNKPKHLNLI